MIIGGKRYEIGQHVRIISAKSVFDDCLYFGVSDDSSLSYFSERFHLPIKSLKRLKKNRCILLQSDWKNAIRDKRYKYKKSPAYKKTADYKAAFFMISNRKLLYS